MDKHLHRYITAPPISHVLLCCCQATKVQQVIIACVVHDCTGCNTETSIKHRLSHVLCVMHVTAQ